MGLSLTMGLSVLAAGAAAAQGVAGRGRTSGASPAYYNPYMNPILNPALTQRPMDPAVPLLYLMGANDAAGGLGSGRLSGVRPANDGGKLAQSMARTMATPGAGASRYFHRGPSQSTGRPTGFQRQNRYFGKNGR
jgi:hypothetical protein